VGSYNERGAGADSHGEAVPRRIGGQELSHDVARQRDVSGDQPALRGRQDEVVTAPLRGEPMATVLLRASSRLGNHFVNVNMAIISKKKTFSTGYLFYYLNTTTNYSMFLVRYTKRAGLARQVRVNRGSWNTS
jgi:hypothetical protein